MGGMNLYFVKGSGTDATVVTPKLTGTLLPGITRDSILSVAKDLGYKTDEVMLSIDDWRDGVTSGEITEIFACGTAAVVSPVGTAKSAMGTWVTGDGSTRKNHNADSQSSLGNPARFYPRILIHGCARSSNAS